MKLYALSLAAMALVATLAHTGSTIEVQVPRMVPLDFVKTAQAQGPITDLCGLKGVEGEQCAKTHPVEEAIRAVEQTLGHSVTSETEDRIQYLYDRTQDKGISFTDAVKTAFCESQWTAQQSNAYRGKKREDSWGIFQISIPHHKDVTREQAMDAKFSIDWAMKNWNSAIWYGYSRASGKCTNGLTIEL